MPNPNVNSSIFTTDFERVGRRTVASIRQGHVALIASAPLTRREAEAWARRQLKRLQTWTEDEIIRVFSSVVDHTAGVWMPTYIGDGKHEKKVYPQVTDKKGPLAIIHVDGWEWYSRAEGSHFKRYSVLVGIDDNGLFARQVVGSAETVAQALDSITPAKVARREHLRQGDVFLVRMDRRGCDTPAGWIAGSHAWDPATRTLTHEPADGRAHRPITAPDEWPSVQVIEQCSGLPGGQVD
jgi:hypothetical protein